MNSKLDNFTDVLSDEICDSPPLSLSYDEVRCLNVDKNNETDSNIGNVQVIEERKESRPRPARGTGQYNQFRSVEEIDEKYKNVFSYPYFNLVQSKVIDDALYSDKSMVVCAPTGSGKTVIFEMAIVHLLMEIEDKQRSGDFKIIYMAPVKALCTERLTEWYPKFTKLGLHCIEVTGDTDVDFYQLSPYKIIITTPEKWDMVTRRWREHRQLVQHVKLLLIDEVHVLNDAARGPVLEAVVSRMKTIESSAQSLHRIEALQKQYHGDGTSTINDDPPKIRFVAVSATVGNPEDVASWLGSEKAPAVFYKFGDECRPVKLRRVVEGYPCSDGASIFKFDIILSYKLWPIIQKYHNGKPTLIFCNTRKSVILTAETLSREITINFNPEQKAKLTALASTMKNKKLQSLILSGVGCHHAGLLFEERTNIEHAFRNRDLPILITTTTLAMGVNLPAHLVIIKNTQQYVNGAYQEYSISTILQMVGRAGRPQFDTEATAVIMTRLADKPRYQALVGGSEPLQSYLHKRLAENLNSEAALGTVGDVAQCVQWLRSTFLFVRAARDPRRYLGLPHAAPHHQISKKIEELCVKAMNGLASSGLITMDEASCIESTEAGRLMSIFYLDLETMKHIMKVNGSETLEQLLWIVCESHELSDMHLRVDERRYLNALNRNQSAATIRFPMKGKITTRQMKLYCVIQAILGCLPISDPSLNQEAMKIMRIADRVCKCLFAYVTSLNLISSKPKYYSVIFNSVILSKCIACHLWENSPYVARQLKGIGPTFSTLLATAGKVNFMLLEESHPRDLERIMNKGPPAGNVLRKQVSLLPKYQLVMTPMDQNTVSIRLDLLNCNYLLENIDQLTAGNGHKSYIIVGDSENHILLLTSFNDTNLINVYNGSMKYEITRLHNFEHKVFAHCISSTFAGIDVQSEYVFTSLEQYPRTVEEKTKTPIQRQTTITDTFKERKRKNTSDIEIIQSKEKKKRENLLIEKFKNLKESFGKTSNQLKYDLHKTTKMSHEILKDIIPTIKPVIQINAKSFDKEIQDSNTNIDIPNIDEIFTDDMVEEEIQNDEFINDDKINDILAEIENEIIHGTKPLDKPSNYQKSLPQNYAPSSKNVGASLTKRRLGKCNAVKSNYNFIDLLERNTDLNDDVEIREDGSTVFSENIKGNIDNYLCNLQNKPSATDSVLSTLIYSPKKVNKDSINSTTILDIPDFRQNSLKPHESKAITEKEDFPIKTDAKVIENSQNCNSKINISTYIQNQTSNENNGIETLIEGTNNNNSSEEATVELPEVIFNKTDNNLKMTENDLSTEKEGGEDFEKEYNSALKYIPNIEYSICCKELSLTPMNICEKYEGSPVIPDTKHDKNIQRPSLDYNVYEKTQNEFTKEHSSNKAIVPLPKPMPQDFCKASELLGQPQNNMLVYNPYSQRAKYRNDSGTTENTPNQYLESKPSSILDARESIDTSEANEQIKKYSFSATKVDVVTNEKPDHIMHVIRKLRVDYDITEILIRGKATSGINISAGVDPIDVKEGHNNLVPQIYQINLNNKINRKTVTEKIQSLDGEVANSNQIATISQHNTVQNNKIDDDAVNESTYEQGKQFPTVENNKPTDKLSAPNKEEETINPKKTIRSILEKYSDIMKNGKSNDENHITVTSETKNSQGISQNHVKNIKSKRPFSIRDIETLNTNLSKEIIQTSSQNPCYSVTPSAVRRQEKESNPIPLSLEPPSRHFKIENNQILKVGETDEINEILPIPNVVYDDLTINDNIESTVTSNFKIDNSMFNPKTLLQHYNNDIEEPIDILPPPPEFCNNGDDLNSSQNFDFNVPIDTYEPIEWKSINNVLSDSLLEKDDYHVQLTPSKEIEVWNLSQDKRSENNEEPFQSIYEPRTSIQSYSQSYAPSSIGINRHDKLKAFTLPIKDKLKRKM